MCVCDVCENKYPEDGSIHNKKKKEKQTAKDEKKRPGLF